MPSKEKRVGESRFEKLAREKAEKAKITQETNKGRWLTVEIMLGTETNENTRQDLAGQIWLSIVQNPKIWFAGVAIKNKEKEVRTRAVAEIKINTPEVISFLSKVV